MIELRPANFQDYSAIAKIHTQSWQKNYRNILSDRFLDNEVEKNHLHLWEERLGFPAGGQLVSVATHHTNIVGFSCLFLDHDPLYGSLLDNLHVQQEFQNTGIGKLLLKDCGRLILENHGKKMYLWVYAANLNARKVYEHLGAIHVQTITKMNAD